MLIKEDCLQVKLQCICSNVTQFRPEMKWWKIKPDFAAAIFVYFANRFCYNMGVDAMHVCCNEVCIDLHATRLIDRNVFHFCCHLLYHSVASQKALVTLVTDHRQILFPHVFTFLNFICLFSFTLARSFK